jgi:hypothetical protein
MSAKRLEEAPWTAGRHEVTFGNRLPIWSVS